ncbi:MAG TPA: phosphatidylglycerophosphatase A [Rhizomicrobium sp.]|nr:phosphatidylglycerophosphatase A [Rhizomicrobium sp.]
MTLAARIATLGGLGRIRPAPGTLASLLTTLAAWGIAAMGERVLVLFAGIVAMAIGGWAAEHYARERGVTDPSECVIDEVAGQFLACAFAPRTLIGYVLAFLLFRALDIWKPWPIGAVERLHGGLGIVADDVLAGVLAGLVLVAFVLLHWLKP